MSIGRSIHMLIFIFYVVIPNYSNQTLILLKFTLKMMAHVEESCDLKCLYLLITKSK